MIGIDKLFEIRKDGHKPEAIDIWVGDDDDPHYEKEWHKHSDTMDYPAILIETKDNIESIDFRFAYGLTIFIRGDNSNRLLNVYEKITKCLPERVLLMFQMEDDEVQILDNKGLLSGTITTK